MAGAVAPERLAPVCGSAEGVRVAWFVSGQPFVFYMRRGEGRWRCFRVSEDLPQKLLPLQQSPSPHLAFTIGPQESPIPAVFGGTEGRGGAVRLVEQSPKPSWQVSAPQ